MKMQVNGVDLGKVDKAHLTRVAAQLGAKVPPGATAQRLVEEVGKIFASPKMNLAGPCDNCGGMSDSSLTECPFCGIGEDAQPPSSQIAGGLTPERAAEMTAGLVITNGEKLLDEALLRINALKAGVTVSLWGIGKEIKGIYDKQLWLQRSEQGRPTYKSFDAFVHHELGGLSKTTAYWLMDIAEAFNEQQVLAYGRTKLGMILKAPKEDRTLLLDRVKAGIGTKALSAEVDKSRQAAGEFVRETSRSTDSTGRDQSGQRAGVAKGARAAQASAAKKAAKKKTKGDSITVAKMLGRQQVKLWQRPAEKGAIPTTRARKIGDKPTGMLDLDNGVQMHFSITTSSAGDWMLIVTTERPE